MHRHGIACLNVTEFRKASMPSHSGAGTADHCQVRACEAVKPRRLGKFFLLSQPLPLGANELRGELSPDPSGKHASVRCESLRSEENDHNPR